MLLASSVVTRKTQLFQLNFTVLRCGICEIKPLRMPAADIAGETSGRGPPTVNKMKAIPSPRSLPVFGTMLSIIAAGGASKLHLYVDERHRQLGSIYREKIGPVSGIFISDGDYMRKIFALEGKYPRHVVPESWILYNELNDCKRGLLFMDGEEWFKFRKAMNNLLLKVDHEEFYQPAAVVSENLVENWKRETVINDLENQLYRWSLEVIVATLLGPENYQQTKTNLSPSIEELSRNVHRIFIESAKLSLLPVKIAARMKFPVWKRFSQAADSTVEQGKNIVEKLLDLEKRNGCENEGGLLKKLLSTQMKEEDLKRIVIDLILAAGDTTAHIMQWILHLLSIETSTQTRIFDELKQFQGREVLKCQLLKGSLKETLRLYPVAPFITRFMPKNVLLDNYEIKANELVLMSLYTSGRNGEYFPEPNFFRPERWSRCDKGGGGSGYGGVLNPNGSLPFALGSRSCVGKKIAETQILVTLSQILRNFELGSNREKPLDIVLHLISVPEKPVKLFLKPRY